MEPERQQYRWPEANQVVRERQTYEEAWSLPRYGDYSPGVAALPWFAVQIGPADNSTVLDLGCGTGKAAVALAARGHRVELADLTPAGLVEEAKAFPFFEHTVWHPIPTSYDYVYCCDVLEHVPTEWTMLAIERMLRASRRGVCLSIGTEPDAFGAYVGTALHQTVQPFTWWRDRCHQLARVRAACDRISHGLFYIEPRQRHQPTDHPEEKHR